MTVRTNSANSDDAHEARVSLCSQDTLSTASVRLFTVTQGLTSAWCVPSAEHWSEDQLVKEGYQSMAPVNSRLAKEFSSKVRKAWPDW